MPLGHEISAEVVEVGKHDIEGEIKRRFPDGVDHVIVSSPPRSMADALKLIRFGGIITFNGLDFGGKSTINIDVNDLIFRKISLIPTFAEPAINFPVSNRLLREGLADIRPELEEALARELLQRLSAIERRHTEVKFTGASPHFKADTHELVAP